MYTNRQAIGKIHERMETLIQSCCRIIQMDCWESIGESQQTESRPQPCHCCRGHEVVTVFRKWNITFLHNLIMHDAKLQYACPWVLYRILRMCSSGEPCLRSLVISPLAPITLTFLKTLYCNALPKKLADRNPKARLRDRQYAIQSRLYLVKGQNTM